MTSALFSMSPEVALALIGQFAGLLIWGGMLTQRVRVLEREVKELKDIDVRVARIEEKLAALVQEIGKLNESLRWMRQPAGYTALNPHEPA